MDHTVRKLSICFALQTGIRTSILTVVPLKTYSLLADVRLVSAVFFISSLMAVSSRFFIPSLVRRFSHFEVLVGAIICAILSASFLATNQLILYLPALSLLVSALAAIEIILTLFVLTSIPRLQITKFERIRIFVGAVPWTIGPWLGILLKLHISEQAPFGLSILLGLILLLAVNSRWFRTVQFSGDENVATQSIATFSMRFFAQPRLRLAWLLAFGRSAWWATFYAYAPILIVTSGLSENAGGLIVSAGTAMIWAVPVWSWVANRIYLRRLLIAGYTLTALLTLTVGVVAGSSALTAATLLVLAAGAASTIDAAGNTLFLRAVRAKERLEMAPVFATFRDFAQCAPPAVFAVLLVFFPLPVVFVATGLVMLGMGNLAGQIPRTF